MYVLSMAEIEIKVDVPEGYKDKFEIALAKVIEQFVRNLRFAVADEILSKSKLTDEQVEKLAEGLKERVAKRHAL